MNSEFPSSQPDRCGDPREEWAPAAVTDAVAAWAAVQRRLMNLRLCLHPKAPMVLIHNVRIDVCGYSVSCTHLLPINWRPGKGRSTPARPWDVHVPCSCTGSTQNLHHLCLSTKGLRDGGVNSWGEKSKTKNRHLLVRLNMLSHDM